MKVVGWEKVLATLLRRIVYPLPPFLLIIFCFFSLQILLSVTASERVLVMDWAGIGPAVNEEVGRNWLLVQLESYILLVNKIV